MTADRGSGYCTNLRGDVTGKTLEGGHTLPMQVKVGGEQDAPGIANPR